MPEQLSEIEAAAGQMLIVGFEGVRAAPAAVQAAVAAGRVGGVILFSRNIGDGEDALDVLAAMNASLSQSVPETLPQPFVAVDQEGGRVRRLRAGVTQIPPMAAVGRTRQRDLAAQVGEVIADELSTLGFNLNFAPCLDLRTNPDNDVIGDRSFGQDPALVADLAGALTVGHYIAGVVPCAKHFPGHGDTTADSHLELPVINHSLERIKAVELVPFVKAVKGGIPMIMTAHLLIPAIDDKYPITLSPHGLGTLLRAQMGFEGVIVSDDLEMKAIADRYTIEEVVELGVTAGIDAFLICHTEAKWQAAYAALIQLAESDEAARVQILASGRRIRTLKAKYLPKGAYHVPDDLHGQLNTPAHQAIIDRVLSFEPTCDHH